MNWKVDSWQQLDCDSWFQSDGTFTLPGQYAWHEQILEILSPLESNPKFIVLESQL